MKMNPVVHFEMPAKDTKRMSDFYAKIFGWELKSMPAEMGEYVLATTTETGENGRPTTPGAINGGFYKVGDDGATPAPAVVIAVDDIKESMEKVKQAGGKVLGEVQDIPGVGLYVNVMDCEGNKVNLLQPNM